MSNHQLNNAARILLVEGPADQGFYQFFCDTYALQAEIDVVVPTDLPHVDLPKNRATKQGVLKRAKILLKNIHRAKAETATWLAWQESPDRGLYNALKKNLLSPAAPGYTALLAWMQQIFPPTPTPP